MCFRSPLARLFIPTLWLLMGAAPPALAAATQSAPAEVALLSPLSIIKRADLDFGTVAVSGAGTAVLDPVSGSVSTTGAVLSAGTGAHAARFTATGSKNAVAIIRLPKNPATLTRVGGTETLTVSNWTTDGAINRKIPVDQTFDFYVGGTVNIAAGQAPGVYVGTFDVTVQYP